eukprot:339555-Heterocapsa_arctica.AAC.1
MARRIKEVDIDGSATTTPHRPVILTFHPKLTSLKALGFRRPPALPTELPIGPRPRQQDWQP